MNRNLKSFIAGCFGFIVTFLIAGVLYTVVSDAIGYKTKRAYSKGYSDGITKATELDRDSVEIAIDAIDKEIAKSKKFIDSLENRK
jgi:hypothetical protein